MFRIRLDRGFEEFAAARMSSFLRTAVFLTGDRDRAEALLQSALLRMARRWRAVRDEPDTYARQVLVTLAGDGRRRSRRRSIEAQPAGAATDRSISGSGRTDSEDLLAALRSLPIEQRTALCLRFWEGLSVRESAAVMHTTEGFVISSASRGITHLAGAGRNNTLNTETTLTDEDSGFWLTERMTRAADDIPAPLEMLKKLRVAYVRRRRRNWTTVAGVLIAAAAIAVPAVLTGGFTSNTPSPDTTGPANYNEPEWAQRCFQRQEQIFGAPLHPAPQYDGWTMARAWQQVTSQGPIGAGSVTAWNGTCIAFMKGLFGPPERTLLIAVVGDVNPGTNGASNPDRIVAARIADPCPRNDPWLPCGK